MGCLFTNVRLGRELAVPRTTAARAIAALGSAAAGAARDRWQRELAAWLAGTARAVLAGAAGFDVGELAWTPDHFAEQQRFVIDMVADAAVLAPPEVRLALERFLILIARHERAWVLVGRRWDWPDSSVIPVS